MYCSSCGEIIDNDCKFCTKCGQMIAKNQLKNKFGKVIFKGNLGESMKLNVVYISLNGIKFTFLHFRFHLSFSLLINRYILRLHWQYQLRIHLF